MKNKVYLQLLGFALFTGGTFNVSKYAVQYFSATHIAAWRFGVAAFVMLGMLIIRKNLKWEECKQNIGYYMLLGIVGVFGFNFCFFLGMKNTEAINGSLIMATNPLVTTILARMILQEKIMRRQAIGMVFGFLGVILVITQGALSVIQNLSLSTGDLFILLGNVCWGLYSVLGRKLIKSGSPMHTTTYTMIVGAIAFISISFVQKNIVPIMDIPLFAWLSILFMAIGTSVLGYLWWNNGVAQIGAAKTSLFFNFVPVVTMIVSFLNGVNITSAQVLGMILVISGVLLSSGFFVLRVKKSSINL